MGRISVRSVMFETLFLITNKTWNSNRAILHRAMFKRWQWLIKMRDIYVFIQFHFSISTTAKINWTNKDERNVRFYSISFQQQKR